MLDLLGDKKRSIYCGDIRSKDIDSDVVICGWVHRRRDLGGLIFIDARDVKGIVQVVVDPAYEEAHKKAGGLRNEYVICIKGIVQKRLGKSNPNLPTGEVEILAKEISY